MLDRKIDLKEAYQPLLTEEKSENLTELKIVHTRQQPIFIDSLSLAELKELEKIRKMLIEKKTHLIVDCPNLGDVIHNLCCIIVGGLSIWGLKIWVENFISPNALTTNNGVLDLFIDTVIGGGSMAGTCASLLMICCRTGHRSLPTCDTSVTSALTPKAEKILLEKFNIKTNLNPAATLKDIDNYQNHLISARHTLFYFQDRHPLFNRNLIQEIIKFLDPNKKEDKNGYQLLTKMAR